jgi:hypothetical protein
MLWLLYVLYNYILLYIYCLLVIKDEIRSCVQYIMNGILLCVRTIHIATSNYSKLSFFLVFATTRL